VAGARDDDDERLIVTGHVRDDESIDWVVHRVPLHKVAYFKLKWRLIGAAEVIHATFRSIALRQEKTSMPHHHSNYPGYARADPNAGYIKPIADGEAPTGGPSAALGVPLVKEPDIGDPNYVEGGHLPGWSAEGQALAVASLNATTPEAKAAADAAIAKFIGFEGADFSSGTAANEAAAAFWNANSPHQ
jgi:hypothetical protein